ncbi:phospholipase D-like domain-containing protein [Paenibacillus oryzisoli]|uniref:phospholipase D-like domain-containing protein n=1 Tax=Paenibacillus oryzisoli TaxID=1850517 RepID=UPI003D2E8E0E
MTYNLIERALINFSINDTKEILGEWAKILEVIKNKKITVHAWLVNGDPVLVGNNIVLLSFKNSMHRETTEKLANRELIERVISDYFNRRMKIVTIMLKNWLEIKMENKLYAFNYPTNTYEYNKNWISEAIDFFGENLVSLSKEELQDIKQLMNSSPSQYTKEILTGWTKILEVIKNKKITVHAWLVNGDPVLAGNNIVILAFKNSMHREITEKLANRDLIERVISEYCNRRMKLVTIMMNDWLKLINNSDERRIGFGEKSKEVIKLNEDWINEAISLFGEDHISIRPVLYHSSTNLSSSNAPREIIKDENINIRISDNVSEFFEESLKIMSPSLVSVLDNHSLEGIISSKTIDDKIIRDLNASHVLERVMKVLFGLLNENYLELFVNKIKEIILPELKNSLDENALAEKIVEFLAKNRATFNVKTIQNEEIKDFFIYALKSAEKELDISSAWVNSYVISEYLELIEDALKRGVTVKILFGYKDGYKDSNRYSSSKKTVEELKMKFSQYGDLFRTNDTNTHKKLIICDEKFYIIGSLNHLSFGANYDVNKNVRSEEADYCEDILNLRVKRKTNFDF